MNELLKILFAVSFIGTLAAEEIKLTQNDFKRLILKTYSRENIDNIESLEEFLKGFDINIQELKKKLTVSVYWNEMIIKRFSKNVSINREEIKKELLKNNKQNEYNLSEILFNIDTGENLDRKQLEIEESIKNIGFETSALLFSQSDTSSNGGLVGWIKENSLNSKIRKSLSNISTNNFTKPILVPGGFLILKINEIRQTKKYEDLDKEIELTIKSQTSNQLAQLSNIYFNKIKKGISINEL